PTGPPSLRRGLPYGTFRAVRRGRFGACPFLRCRSSVVEHSLGKGEGDSSILSGSTIPAQRQNVSARKKPPVRAAFFVSISTDSRTIRRSPCGRRLSHRLRPCGGRPSPCPSCLASPVPCRPWPCRRRP